MKIKDLLELEPDAEEKFANVWLGYTESEGDPHLREEISHMYQTVDKEEIFCFAGAEEGIMAFMNSILTPQDHIIVQFPGYQSLYEIAASIGCQISKWALKDTQDGWDLDLTALEDMLKPHTKAIIINFPHNPTGCMISKKSFQAIIDFAQIHDLYVFSDEVYRFLEYKEEDRLPAAVDLYEKGFSLGVMSKSYGLAGLRIGWIATHDYKTLELLKQFKDYTTICNSAPSEYLSLLALKHKDTLLERNISIITRNLTLLEHFFEKYDEIFTWHQPKAGSVGFVKIKIEENVEKFCIDVVESVGVLLLPSTLFNFGDNYFRLGFGRENLPEALVKFENYLQDRFFTSSSL